MEAAFYLIEKVGDDRQMGDRLALLWTLQQEEALAVAGNIP